MKPLTAAAAVCLVLIASCRNDTTAPATNTTTLSPESTSTITTTTSTTLPVSVALCPPEPDFDGFDEALRIEMLDLFGDEIAAKAAQLLEAQRAHENALAGFDHAIHEETDTALRLILEGHRERAVQKYQLFLVRIERDREAGEVERLMDTIAYLRQTGEFETLQAHYGIGVDPVPGCTDE